MNAAFPVAIEFGIHNIGYDSEIGRNRELFHQSIAVATYPGVIERKITFQKDVGIISVGIYNRANVTSNDQTTWWSNENWIGSSSSSSWGISEDDI
jgi:hypothetical protein